MEFFNYEPITVNKRICINPGAIESLHKTTASLPSKTSIKFQGQIMVIISSTLNHTVFFCLPECLAEQSDLVFLPTPGFPLINIIKPMLIQSVN